MSQKSEFYGIEHLQIGNLPAMGSLTLNVVFGRFLQRPGKIKRSQVMFTGGKNPQHKIFVLVFSLAENGFLRGSELDPKIITKVGCPGAAIFPHNYNSGALDPA